MEITSEAIRLNNQIYPTKNISSARMVERTVKVPEPPDVYRKRRNRRMIVGLLFVAAALSIVLWRPAEIALANLLIAVGVPRSLVVRFLLWAIAAAMGWIGYLMLRRWTEKERWDATEYGIELLSNSGGMTLFWSRDKNFMTKVRDLVFKALTTTSATFSYNVNIDNKQINDNSVNILDKSTHNIFDYSVNFSHNKGLSGEDIAFMNGAFNEALKGLADLVAKTSNTDLEKELKGLVEVLRSQNPEKGRLRSAWGKVRGVCEAWETGTTVNAMLTTIGTGVATLLNAMG